MIQIPYFLIFSINVVRRSFKSFAASLVLSLLRFMAAFINVISMSLRKERKSTTLFVSNQLAKSWGSGKLFDFVSFSEECEKASLSNSSKIVACSAA